MIVRVESGCTLVGCLYVEVGRARCDEWEYVIILFIGGVGVCWLTRKSFAVRMYVLCVHRLSFLCLVVLLFGVVSCLVGFKFSRFVSCESWFLFVQFVQCVCLVGICTVCFALHLLLRAKMLFITSS